MNPAIAVLAAGVGYLLGSLSFARFVMRVFGRREVQDVELNVPGLNDKFHSDSVSATAVRLQLGPKYGCLAAILDMAKAGIPTLLFRLLYPAESYFLIVAVMAVVGHNWPIYYHFKGGRGQSPTIGGLLVIDPLGLIVVNVVGAVVARHILHNAFLIMNLWTLLLIPWFLIRTSDPAYWLYAFGLNIASWVAFIPEYREYRRVRREGGLQTAEDGIRMMYVNRGLGRWAQVITRVKPAPESHEGEGRSG
jgi:glycerol-3-phosphate acyltransferase PlsY